jgi:predicted RNase H-like nuclease (RuvC/YqgF family)
MKNMQRIDKSNLSPEEKDLEKKKYESSDLKSKLETSKMFKKEYKSSYDPLKYVLKNEEMLSDEEEENLQKKISRLNNTIKLQEEKIKKNKPEVVKLDSLETKESKTSLERTDKKSELEKISKESTPFLTTDLVTELRDIKKLMKTLYGGFDANAKVDRRKAAAQQLSVMSMIPTQTASNVDLASSPKIPEFTQGLKS